MNVYLHIYVHHICVCVAPTGARKGHYTFSCEPPCGCCELNLGSLHQVQSPAATDSSL